MGGFTAIMIVLIGCAMVFGIVYISITSSNKENMAMIEAGMNPKDAGGNTHSKLRLAMLLLFVPIGILVGHLTHHIFDLDPEPAAVLFSFLFGGLALTITYVVEWALKQDEDSKDD